MGTVLISVWLAQAESQLAATMKNTRATPVLFVLKPPLRLSPGDDERTASRCGRTETNQVIVYQIDHVLASGRRATSDRRRRRGSDR